MNGSSFEGNDWPVTQRIGRYWCQYRHGEVQASESVMLQRQRWQWQRMGRRILACTSLAVMSIAVAGGLIGSCISDRIADENCKYYGKDDFGGNLEDAYEISAPILKSKYLPYQNIYESLADGHEIRVCGQINKDKMDYAIEEYLDNHPDVVKTTIQQS